MSPERLTEIRSWSALVGQISFEFAAVAVRDLLGMIDAMAATPAPMEEGHAYVMQLKAERDALDTQLGDALERLAVLEKADT